MEQNKLAVCPIYALNIIAHKIFAYVFEIILHCREANPCKMLAPLFHKIFLLAGKSLLSLVCLVQC